MGDALVFYGTVVHSVSAIKPLVVLRNTVVAVQQKRIIGISSDVENEAEAITFITNLGLKKECMRKLNDGEFLMPGFVDTHIHAPQYVNVGIGYHLTLLDWLDTYTFKSEAKFSDTEHALDVYEKVVKRTLKNGTTTASYFATIHTEASLVLADVMDRLGQRGFVGKVCMDRNSPDYYVETTEESLSSTKRFVDSMKEKYGSNEDSLLKACITPRFAVSCTEQLMSGLANLAKEHDLPIQTHMSENKDEISFVRSEFNVEEYIRVYENAGLLTSQTILAHCVHSDQSELTTLKQHSCGISHCPSSNTNIVSGAMNAKVVQSYDIKLGLGTDVSGGYSTSILDNLRKSVEVSKLVALQGAGADGDWINHCDAFYLATLGGAQVMNLDKRIGNFEVGKEFDALVIDTACEASPFDTFAGTTPEESVQKFIFCGDDRNITDIYVAGRKINTH